MRDKQFDAVIVGSGFGGAVMAYRLAEAGLRVCVLERGKKYPPGSFPRTPAALSRATWDPDAGKQGLFDIWSFRTMDAVTASGLGGGSLVYSNVLLRKDERWFVTEGTTPGVFEHWPVNRADLDPHYDAVEKVLRPKPYPFAQEPYADTPKTHAMRDAAAAVRDCEWFLPPLTVNFAPSDKRPGVPFEGPPDMHGEPRSTCRLCGECNIGCNYGSKDSLDFNYLSMAQRAGAELLTRAEVLSFEPAGAYGYRVNYVEHTPALEGRPYRRSDLPTHTIRAKRLILAAGALGSTALLLRMRRDREAFGKLSRMLGHRFSGNGDLLTMALHCCDRDDHRGPRRIDASFGPVITSAIRVTDALDSPTRPPHDTVHERGLYIEDAGFPAFLAWVLESAPVPSTIGRALGFAHRYLAGHLGFNSDTNLSAELSEFIGDARLTETSLPFLCMGRDVASGVMHVDAGDNLDLHWSMDDSAEYIDRVRQMTQRLADALGGYHADNPLWRLRRFITVHPLGGCPMGRHAGEGVVDSWGHVFGYPGLYVADGATMPGPVGANPSLTIAAMADRCADGILRELGR
ncbi:GMC oxidoreductase [Haliangium ochraceum]|uniref:Cholesterol oxidase n=1 Tax=Haliangium ochraceum (strain DSM 14365 / JCM 11303 / SMP-2) TaxID=502025 RepID=D0LVG4_HALO1|nr:GMC family oxidoreductase [Haliangium ochraceum]ACY17525.1 glucose-methanol-choline oxidoreductase [Haliangium ochraceum DSM 14365]